MAFPRNLLNPGEEIAIDLHPHWWYFFEPAVTLRMKYGESIGGMNSSSCSPGGRPSRAYRPSAPVVARAGWVHPVRRTTTPGTGRPVARSVTRPRNGWFGSTASSNAAP